MPRDITVCRLLKEPTIDHVRMWVDFLQSFASV